MEALERRLAKESFPRFIERFSHEPAPAAHHRLIIEKLEAVERGEIKRLMVFMPPGSAKSTYANVLFSAWYMGKNPGKKLITASYSQEVADKWGRRVRGIVREPEYADTFSAALSQESQAAGRWELSTGAEYYAVGVGSGVTSFRADLAIIDDPVKGREEADSLTIREKVKEWYGSDLWTRLKPGAAVIVIMTRWHEDDLAGWLLEEAKKGGEQWDVLSLPMIAEANDPLNRKPGEQLWPEWFTEEMVAMARRDARKWSALYQQRPAPEEGAFFRREWLRWYDEAPKHLRIYGASDYAVTDGDGDYTVHGVFGIAPDHSIYVLDWWREQEASDVWVETMLDMAAKHKPLAWAEESGQIIKSLGPFITKRQREREQYFYRKQFSSAADKPTRAQGIRGRMAMGMVYFPKGKPWAEELVRELLTFPAGKYDDQVDVFSLLGRMLDSMAAGELPPPPADPNREPTFNEILRESRRNQSDEDRRL